MRYLQYESWRSLDVSVLDDVVVGFDVGAGELLCFSIGAHDYDGTAHGTDGTFKG